ncbi:MAG: hypothetical protein OXF32_02165 [Anaerolineaceae bacterium]|nr:hypothetical protein [Anaerolineaceae bacterium]
MKTRPLAIALALFVLCTAASAQDYQIRTGANINLRDTYSLDGVVVEVVPSGSILQVVGRFNRWLRINRNGNTLWMADWVPYTRVGDGGEGGQTQSQIDNCCFVDRQCRVDADWVSGYWAFQNGQCAAPLQPDLQLPLTSTGSDSSEVNNCCYIGRQCNTDEDWTRGHWAFQNDHCDVPAGFIIEGPPNFLARVKEVLRFLESRSPQWFSYAMSGLDKIRMVDEPGVSSIRARTRTWRIAPDRFFNRTGARGVIRLASSMVHEACHAHRYMAGLQSGGYVGEKDCLRVQIEATETFDNFGGHVSWLRNLLANIDDPEYQWWH